MYEKDIRVSGVRHLGSRWRGSWGVRKDAPAEPQQAPLSLYVRYRKKKHEENTKERHLREEAPTHVYRYFHTYIQRRFF